MKEMVLSKSFLNSEVLKLFSVGCVNLEGMAREISNLSETSFRSRFNLDF
jgi:hypothetical protein